METVSYRRVKKKWNTPSKHYYCVAMPDLYYFDTNLDIRKYDYT